VEAAPGVVVVDEAYFAFAQHSFLPVVAEYDNLLVLRTVSKMGLAGLRLGVLIGHPAWIGQLEKCRLPYNINVLTQVSAEFALEYRDVLDAQTARIREDRGELARGLAGLGVHVWPSEANFLTFRAPAGQAVRVFEQLKQAGVLIKNLDGSAPLLSDCLRVTVGRPDENAAFLRALRQALNP
jgi:histidinol-phosphate aminotransferase